MTIVGIGEGNAAKAGVLSGQVDAIMATTADVIDYQIAETGRLEILKDWRTIPHSSQAVIGRQRWVDANLVAAKGFARAVLKAKQLIQKDPAEVQKIIKQLFTARRDAYVKAYADEVPKLLFAGCKISPQGYIRMNEILRTLGPELKPIDQSKIDLTDKLLGR